MTARDWALLELNARRLPGWHRVALHAKTGKVSSPPADPRDRALAEHLVIGVIKNHLLLLHLQEHFSGRRLRQIDLLVQKIISLSLYQLRFMQRIPASAAVDQAVEQCRRFGRARAAGFANAVLRNATRQPDPPLPDETRDPEEYARIVLSHPPQLFRRLRQILSLEDALRFCRQDNGEPPTLVRLFRGVTIDQLAEPGVTITPHEQPGIAVVEPAKRPMLERWARLGLAQVQDATSARAVQQMEIQHNQRLLDRCSGLGTKTLQMREYAGPDGSIIAVDPSAERCQQLRALLDVRGITNVHVHPVAMLRDIDPPPEPFHAALVDAPCSNSGVLPRRPEARYAQDDRALRSLERLQRDILDDTAPFVRAGGVLVYSTCSVWPQENERQVEAFLARHGEYALHRSETILPAFDGDPRSYHDGGFIALLHRRSSCGKEEKMPMQ